MDEILLKSGDVNNTGVANKKVTISAFALDKEGFKIEKLNLTNCISNVSSGAALPNGTYAVLIKQGNTTLSDTGNDSLKGFTVNGNGEIVFNTVAVSGAAISGGAIQKMPIGSYSINLFRGNAGNQAAYVIGTVISVIDTQDIPTFRWKANEISASIADPVAIASAALDLYFDVDRNGSIDYNNEKVVISDANVVVTGDRAYIKTVTYHWVLSDGNYYDFVIDVNRTVKIQ